MTSGTAKTIRAGDLRLKVGDGRLTILRRQSRVINVAGAVLLWWIVLVVAVLSIVAVPAPMRGAGAGFAAIVLLVLAVLLRQNVKALQGWEFVFDRDHDFVTRDGNLVCAMSRIRLVRLDGEWYRAGSGGFFPGIPGQTLGLSLVTEGGTEIPLADGTLSGIPARDGEQVGKALAEFLGVPLATPNGAWQPEIDTTEVR